jgi:hypothetical protein
MNKEITRRDAAWLIARAAAIPAGASFFARWTDAAQHSAEHDHSPGTHAPPDPHNWSAYRPQFFSPEEFRMLDAFTSILIPSDDTPGAREAHVTAFIDFVVNAAAEYAPETQTHWREAMRWLGDHRFGTLNPDAQLELVREMSGPEHDQSREHPGYSTYHLIKDMTVHAFYTSRVGLVDILEYKGLAYLTEFPGCDHPEHQQV